MRLARLSFVSQVGAFVALLITSLGFAQQANLHLGDVDDDGVITVRDIALVVEHLKGTTPLDDPHAVLADVTKDGAVNQADVDELIKEVLETRTPENLPLATVRFTSPASGEGDVSVNRETILHFTVPLALNATLDTTQFYAEFAGRKVLSRVEISSDRKKASLFYLEPLPSNSRVKVTFDGSALTDLIGRAFDTDGDGIAGGVYRMSFDTHTNGGIPATGITGRVLLAAPEGSATVPVGFADRGIVGVTITVDGQEQTMRTTTDAQGYFTLSPCPSGVFFVHIDGRTSTSPASQYPSGRYFPVVGKQWEAVPGKADNLAAGTGIIYLPCVCPGTLQPTSQTQNTTVAFPQQVLTMNPDLAGTMVDIPANAVFSDDGTRGGQIGLAPVPADRLPSPLPPGLNLPLVITVQSDGATNLDRPAPVTFPNLPDPVTGIKPGPGEKSALWSFNHDTGQWEVVGPMTVTADGNFVKSDAGVGIRQPGWHGAMPGCQGNGQPAVGPPDQDPDPCHMDAETKAKLVRQALTNGLQCLRELNPSKVIRSIAKLAEALDIAFEVASALDDIQKTLSKYQLESDKQKKIAYLNAISVSLKALEFKSCTEFPEKLHEGGDATLGRKMKAAVACAKAALATIYAYCEALPEDCDKSIWLNGLCIASGELKAFVDYVDSYIGIVERYEQSLLKVSFCAALQHTEVSLNAALVALRASPSSSPPANANSAAPQTNSDPTDLTSSIAELITASEDFNGYGQAAMAAHETARSWPILFDEYTNAITQNSIALRNTGAAIRRSVFYSMTVGSAQMRGRTSADGTFQTILPPDDIYSLAIYDPTSKLIGSMSGISTSNGVSMDLGAAALDIDAGIDTDADGLSDDAEGIIGTDPNNPDTDNDGVTDGAELKNGTDPLSGIAAATGIVGKAEVSAGDCRDVAAVNDVLAAACGTEGLQLLGVRQGLSPTKLAKVPTPSSATVVAMTGSLVAVGMGSGGTLIVDASTPDTPQVLRTIKLGSSVKSLAAVENTVYIGFEDGRITAVDMLTGRLVTNINVGSAVHDLAIGQGVLYAAIVSTLKTIAVTADGTFGAVNSLTMSGTVGAGGQRLRLFRGTDRLYAVHTQGFNVFDLTSPNAPTLIRNNTDGAFGWRHIIANGSGLALAAMGPNSTDDGPHNVSLYDLGTDKAQANFLTTFTLPGSAYSSVFYNGLAYVADGTAGVQVVNIRPFDTLKVPPTITLNVTNTAGAVTEGGFVPVSALVTDDVQVRNVEFYVDGVKVETDGNFPFETRVLAPRSTVDKTTTVIKAKATDTGGNFAWSSEITLNLNTETIPPTVVSMTPPNGQFMAQCSGFTLKFSEPVKNSTLTSSTVRFYAAGPDGLIGTDDDTSVSASLLGAANDSGTYRDTSSWQAAGPLPPGIYRVLATLGIQDTAGNALAAPYSSVFIVSGGNDSDGDGLPDDVELALGCSPDNQDSNGNGKADGDEDFDGDGLTNAFELRYGLQPNNTDSNGNGINDALEDSDRDGLTTAQEMAAESDPTKADTDGDGWPDQVEVEYASKPNDAKSKPLSMFVGTSIVNAAIIGGGTNFATPPTNIVIIGGGTNIAAPPTSVRIESPPP